MDKRTLKAIDGLPEHIREHYQRKLRIEEILSIHKGYSKHPHHEWVEVILMNGEKDRWSRQLLSPYWDCQSIVLHKTEPLVRKVVRTHAIARLAKAVKCRVCGKALEKGTFARILFEDGIDRRAICLEEGQAKEVIDGAWAKRQAPRVRKNAMGKRAYKAVVKRHSISMN